MKFRYFLSSIVSVVVLIIISALASCEDSDETGPVVEENLIAHYPLQNNDKDVTELNGPATLTNAPFQSGSIYCNGIYTSFAGPNPDGCVVETPAINSINLESFGISVDFNVGEKRTQPVWVIGVCARWLGFILNDDGKISLLYNNHNLMSTNTSYSLNQWHTAKIIYNNTTATIYLDEVLAGSIEFTPDLACSNTDTVIGVTNYSNGGVFKGNIKNIKVYGPE
jgi:hypothetical protein